MTDDGNPQGTPPESPTPPGASTTAAGRGARHGDRAREEAGEREPRRCSSGSASRWSSCRSSRRSSARGWRGRPTRTRPPPRRRRRRAEIDEAAFEDALEEILPAGSAVRAGTGVPESGKGYEGDVYIDISTADVYLFQDGDWTLVGNIRTVGGREPDRCDRPGRRDRRHRRDRRDGRDRRDRRAGRARHAAHARRRSARQPRRAPPTATSTSTPRPSQFYECTDEEWMLVRPDRQRRCHADARAHRGAREG